MTTLLKLLCIKPALFFTADIESSDPVAKDDPMLSRLFDSVRSGRRRSRHLSDDLRGDSASRRRLDSRGGAGTGDISMRGEATDGADTSARTAALPPSRGRSNSRGRLTGLQQQADELQQEHLRQLQQQADNQFKVKAWSVESRELDDKTEQETRSSSVEGRLEGHEIVKGSLSSRKPPINVSIASYQERAPVTIDSSVKKAKSFREVGQPLVVVRRESSRRSWFGRDSNVQFQQTSESARLSASYDSLDDNTAHSSCQMRRQTPSQSVVSLLNNKESKKSTSKAVFSHSQSSALSSTDSLTTTEIPGVYIRPLSQYKKIADDVVEPPTYFCTPQTQFGKYSEPIGDGSSGPLSLDSSITLIPRDDEIIRKTSSSDHVGASGVQARIIYDPVQHSPESKHIPFVDMKYKISHESHDHIKTDGFTPISVDHNNRKSLPEVAGPANVLRSMSLRTAESAASCGILSRRASSADELDPKDSQLDATVGSQPRAKLWSRDSSVVDDQETEQPAVPEFMRIQLNKVDSKPQKIYSVDNDDENTVPETPQDKKLFNHSSLESVDSTSSLNNNEKMPVDFHYEKRRSVGDRQRRESSLSQSSLSRDAADDVALRRPLRREKSMVMESTQLHKKEDEPELFKVFARRSFKVRECFNPADNNQDDEDEGQRQDVRKVEDPAELVASLSSQMMGVTKINPIYSTPTPPRTPLISNSFNNKFSVGSPTIPFKPPLVLMKQSLSSSPQTSEFNSLPTSDSDVLSCTSTSEPSSFESAIISDSITKPAQVVSTNNNKLADPSNGEVSNEQQTQSTAFTGGNKVSARPMFSNRDSQPSSSINFPAHSTFTSVSSPFSTSGNVTSVTINNSVTDASDVNHAKLTKSAPSVVHITSSPSLKPSHLASADAVPLNIDAVPLNTDNTISISWPPRNAQFSPVLSNQAKNMPSSQVKMDQLNKYTTAKKNVEIVEMPKVKSDLSVQTISNSAGEEMEESAVSQVQIVRRKFMNPVPLVKASMHSTTGVSSMNQSVAPITVRNTPANTASSVSTVRNTPANTASSVSTVFEARNIAPSFSVSVRSTTAPTSNTVWQPSLQGPRSSHPAGISTSPSSSGSSSPSVMPASSKNATNYHRHSIGGSYVPHPRQQIPLSSSPSPPLLKRMASHPPTQPVSTDDPPLLSTTPGSSRHSTPPVGSRSPMISSGASADGGDAGSSGDDWRALVKQRREDRLKQSKSVENIDEPGDVSCTRFRTMSYNEQIIGNNK